jgi:hypothetical protein
MSRTFHHSHNQNDRRIRIRSIRKDPPDYRRLARALISLAEAQAEADAKAELDERQKRDATKKPGNPSDTSPVRDDNKNVTNDEDAA